MFNIAQNGRQSTDSWKTISCTVSFQLLGYSKAHEKNLIEFTSYNDIHIKRKEKKLRKSRRWGEIKKRKEKKVMKFV